MLLTMISPATWTRSWGELVVMDLIDELRVGDRICGVGSGEDDKERDERRHEQERAGSEQVGPGGAVGLGKRFHVEALDPLPDLAAAPVDDAVAAGHEAV